MVAVEIEDEAGVRWITFNRPARLNVLTIQELRAVTESLAGLAGVSAIVFTGAGDRAFSAGMHVASFVDLDPAGALRLITAVRDFVAAARLVPVPTICAVNGYCLGVAFELALACDIRVVAEHASFGLPEVRVGVPSVIDASLLQQHVGLSMAKEMILTGDIYPVDRLAAFGLCNAVVPAADLRAEAARMAARLTAHTPTVIAAQKRLFESWQNMPLAAGIDASLAEFAGVFAVPETNAAVRSAYVRISGAEPGLHPPG